MRNACSWFVSKTAFVVFSFVSTGVWAGASHDGHEGHSSAQAQMPIGQQGKAGEVTRTIEVDLFDNYFEPEQIAVSAGETIRFKLNNEGALVHEFSLGTPAMHEASQDMMKMMVDHGVIQGGTLNRERMAMDMGNGHTMAHDDPGSVLLAPGETAELVWQFGQPTTLEFACNVPGHYQAGMVGDVEFK
ncbi:cupredoxin domain-containing protein [Marinobacter fonticola]|uniref:cupredoxin domain-containing protein n=1 Tax=Marinobacter fonticola TaxID=2603215 RepID=UPI0011E75D02|nr:plastocyanin/azurin family copper-binding protein [Marinobacter fonticola]